MVEITVVIPVFNESDSLIELNDRLSKTLDTIGKSYEILYIDDYSSDESRIRLKEIKESNPSIRIVYMGCNYGKFIILPIGYQLAKGDIIVTIDSDLQDYPEEIPFLLDKIDEGNDLVIGYRYERKDTFSKKVQSRLFNLLNRVVFGIRLHDINCPLKAFRKDVGMIGLSGDLMRYQAVIANALGYHVTEVKVSNKPRKHGTSHFGIERIGRGLFDLVKLKYLVFMKNLKFEKKLNFADFDLDELD